MSGDYNFVHGREAIDWNFIIPTIQATYFGQGRSRQEIIQACEGSLTFGVMSRSLGIQLAFARVITDGVTYAWISDCVVHTSYRRRKVGKFLIESILSESRFKGLVFHLSTVDAHGFYRKFGFVESNTMCRLPRA